MKTIAAVLLVVACVAVNCVKDDPWIDQVFNEASIKLFNMEQDKLLGAINLSQSIIYRPKRITDVIGRLWGLPAGKYFGVVYPVNTTCDQDGLAPRTYNAKIQGQRPLIVFFDKIDDRSGRDFMHQARHLSLGLDEGNNIINHTVLVYPATWDQSGPLYSYFQPARLTAVACGKIVRGLLEHHVFQMPEPESEPEPN